MTALWRGTGFLLAGVAAVGTAWLSQAPYQDSLADQAMVRVVIGVRPEQLEHCRRATAEELAALPPHMRQSVICEGRSAHYRLAVWIDDAQMVDAELTGGGVQHDRPIHAFRENAVRPGTRRLRIRWTRIEAPASAAEATPADSLNGRDRRDSETRARRRLEAAPSEMELDETVEVRPRQVVLVRYKADDRRLVIMRP